LFKWLDKGKYIKCVHPITIEEIKKNSNKQTVETLSVKLESYEQLISTTPIYPQVKVVSDRIDVNQNDQNDTVLLNEIFCERIDFLITKTVKFTKKLSY